MKKRVCLMLCMLLCYLITACDSNAPKNYVQREGVPRPDTIEAETGSTTLTFCPTDVEYERLYETLMQNWWSS